MDSDIAAALAALTAEVRAARQTTLTVSVQRIASLYSDSPEATALAAWQTERGRIKHLVRELGTKDAAALTLRDLDDYRRARWNAAPATRNRELVRLTAILRWAVDRGHLSRFPLGRVKLEAEKNERNTHRSEDDVRHIVQALQARGRHAIAALVATCYDGGLRRAEACRLRRDQVDDRAGVISLAAADTKGKRGRATVLSSWASELIRNIPAGKTNSAFVFCSARGRPFNPRTVLRYYQQACDEAGIAGAPGERNWLHDLRAGFADQQIAIGTQVPHLMEMAGWRDYRTARRYMRRPPKMIAASAATRLNDARRPPLRAPLTQRSPIVKGAEVES